MLILLLAIQPAEAACTPTAWEDGVDTLDDDCDGMSAVRRELVTSFDALSAVNNDWTLVRSSVVSGELAMTTLPSRRPLLPAAAG